MDVTCQLAIWWDILKEDMDIKRSPNRMQSGMKQLGTVLQLLVYLFFYIYLSIYILRGIPKTENQIVNS